LVQLRFPQLSFDLGCRLVDAAATAGAPQRRSDTAHRQPGGRSRGRRDRQHGAGFGAGDPQREPIGEHGEERRVELAQQRPQLVMCGGAPPDRVLVSRASTAMA
jgi:hypothetical protein